MTLASANVIFYPYIFAYLFIASAVATATATVAPTMGLLPMPRKHRKVYFCSVHLYELLLFGIISESNLQNTSALCTCTSCFKANAAKCPGTCPSALCTCTSCFSTTSAICWTKWTSALCTCTSCFSCSSCAVDKDLLLLCALVRVASRTGGLSVRSAIASALCTCTSCFVIKILFIMMNCSSALCTCTSCFGRNPQLFYEDVLIM